MIDRAFGFHQAREAFAYLKAAGHMNQKCADHDEMISDLPQQSKLCRFFRVPPEYTGVGRVHRALITASRESGNT